MSWKDHWFAIVIGALAGIGLIDICTKVFYIISQFM